MFYIQLTRVPGVAVFAGNLASHTEAELAARVASAILTSVESVGVVGTDVSLNGEPFGTLHDGHPPAGQITNDPVGPRLKQLIVRFGNTTLKRRALVELALRPLVAAAKARGLTKAQVQGLVGNLYDAVDASEAVEETVPTPPEPPPEPTPVHEL
jgi:hypothetical protein